MTIYCIDPVNGDYLNGGTSQTVLASGSDGYADGTNYTIYSASVTFLPEYVGHCIQVEDASYRSRYKIAEILDAHTLRYEAPYDYDYGYAEPPHSLESDMLFRIGGSLPDMAWSDTPVTSKYLAELQPSFGDEVRVVKTPEAYSIGTGVWTSQQPVIAMNSAIFSVIDECITNWTVANAGQTTAFYSETNSTLDKRARGGSGVSFFRAKSGSLVNTKYWYRNLGSIKDFSAFQNIAVQFCMESAANFLDDSFVLCLCSDTIGATIIKSYPIKAPPGSNITKRWVPLLLSDGGNLPNNVQSIAIYSGSIVPSASYSFALTGMVAVKGAGDPLEFSYNHLIGPVHNKSWEGSTTYSLGDIRKPKPANRNGFRYVVTVAGTTGATEPVWPLEENESVVDGTVTWTTEGPEDTWYPVSHAYAPNFLVLDCGIMADQIAGDGTKNWRYERFPVGVPVEMYARKPLGTYYNRTIVSSATKGPYLWLGCWVVRGSHTEPTVVSGGWNETFTEMTGETWWDGCNYKNEGFDSNLYLQLENVSFVRYNIGVTIGASGNLKNVHANGNVHGIHTAAFAYAGRASGCHASRNLYKGFGYDMRNFWNTTAKEEEWFQIDMLRCCFDDNGAAVNHYVSGSTWVISRGYSVAVGGGRHRYVYARNYLSGAKPLVKSFGLLSVMEQPAICEKFRANNDVPFASKGRAHYVFSDYLPANAPTASPPIHTTGVLSGPITYKDIAGVAGTSITFTPHGVISVVTDDNRRTLFGFAWKIGDYNQSNVYGHVEDYPLRLPLILVRLVAGTPRTVSIWFKSYEDARMVGILRCRGGQIAGIPNDVVHKVNPPSGYAQMSITLTATETGYVSVEAGGFLKYPEDGTYNDIFLDDLLIE